MAQVTDPVCGMRIDSDTAPAMLAHDTHSHYFCSEECRRRFEADPVRYGDTHMAGEAGSGHGEKMEQHEPPYTTTGGWFTAPKFGAAGSGGLEYEPLPEAHDDEGHRRG
ncbi:MAG TPA: YHS domain-containing protein [Longimicrobiaceae bacterium]|nr:YHS domain-containing protein [Longimicrobiaceae bacterium]